MTLRAASEFWRIQLHLQRASHYDLTMTRNVGKAMQVLALMLLPASMLMQLTAQMRASSVSVMLLLMLFGIALFCVGRVVEGYGRHTGGMKDA